MNATATQYFNSSLPVTSTTQFNLANIIRSIIADTNLSHGSSRLLVQLVLSAGRKGETWYLIQTLADLTTSSRTQVKLYLKELVEKNRIRIAYRPGRSSKYQIVGIYDERHEVGRKIAHIKQSYKSKSNVIENNVVSICPEQEIDPAIHGDTPEEPQHTKKPEKPLIDVISDKKPVIRMDIVKEILDLTRDHKSLGFWIKFVRSAPLATVYLAISSLKSALAEGQVAHPGRYMVGIIKRIYPDLLLSTKHALRQPQEKISAVLPIKQPEIEPEIERNPVLNMSELKNILAMLERKTL